MSRKKQRLTGQAALEQAYNAVDHSSLRDHLGVELPDELLRLALTHRSFANENGNLPNNERLEFLGDAVLGLSVAAALYETYPDKAESDISKMRASIVSRYGLADIAREIGLGPHILLGRGEILTGGLEKDSILADTTEAILGAIYRRHGFHTARDVVLRLFGEKLAHACSTSRNTDWKTSLQERAAERKYPMPVYDASSTGPDHDRTFTASVSILGVKLGIGVGANKKTAEQQAAQEAHAVLSDGSANQALVEAQLQHAAAEAARKNS